MPKRLKSRAKKAGLPPGSLVHIGERLSETTKITLLDYSGDHILEKVIQNIEDLRAFKDQQTVSWVHVEGIHDTRVLEQLGDVFGLHPLILEDIKNHSINTIVAYISSCLKLFIYAQCFGTDAFA